MRGYSTRDVAELLGLSAKWVRAFAREGLTEVGRGPRGEYRFSFQDIVLLRAAKSLVEAEIHPRRVWRALRRLKAQLPKGQPLSAVRLSAEGDHIVVRDHDTAWQPESGQVTFDFSVAELADRVAPLARRAAEVADEGEVDSDTWFEIGADLEVVSALAEAKAAYRKALELDATHAEAHVNLGRLLHAEGALREAESHYRQAATVAPDNVTAAFNLGVALEDQGRIAEAMETYRQAIRIDGRFADAHYNLAHLYEQTGNTAAAIRHLSRYKTLTQ